MSETDRDDNRRRAESLRRIANVFRSLAADKRVFGATYEADLYDEIGQELLDLCATRDAE